MRWRRPTRNNNNQLRKQFLQWMVPAKYRHELGLEDGTAGSVVIQLDSYEAVQKVVLTSGGEIRLSKAIADDLRSFANASPLTEISFDLTIVEQDMESLTLIAARKEAVETQAYDPQNDKDARERIAALIVRRQGQPEFRKQLMEAYKGRCAISGADCPDALEAAHIRPYKGQHTNSVENGILLRGDIHTLFDLGKLSITSDYKIVVSDAITSTVYKEFNGKKISLPADKNKWPLFL